MKFNIQEKDPKSSARTGLIKTQRGTLSTPLFMPVGTTGSVKAVHQKELEEDIRTSIILGNTYHLYLRPGMDVIEKAGGLHAFIGWKNFILTDSGGYQVYSLSKKREITEDGVAFQSHIDGSAHFFSPEKVIDIQRTIGSDFIMPLDECTPYPCSHEYAGKSLQLTNCWLKRCRAQMDRTGSLYGTQQTLFPIVQGSVYPKLRIQSSEFVSQTNPGGIAIGGLSVGEPNTIMYGITQTVCEVLPRDVPRYLMGVGTPANLLECISRGVDMFDCVIPTRNARHGILYTPEGIINIKNLKWKYDNSPVNMQPLSFADRYYSKAYLRHLFMTGEYLAFQISTINNLVFYQWLIKTARDKILDGNFYKWKNEILPKISRRL